MTPTSTDDRRETDEQWAAERPWRSAITSFHTDPECFRLGGSTGEPCRVDGGDIEYYGLEICPECADGEYRTTSSGMTEIEVPEGSPLRDDTET